MTTFYMSDDFGVGYNMSPSSVEGVSLMGEGLNVGPVVYDDGRTVILNVYGNSVIKSVGMNYAIRGDTYFIEDIVYFDGAGNVVMSIVDVNLVGNVNVTPTFAEVTTLADTFYGTSFKDTIYSGYQNDIVFGYDGSDRLFGGTGNDLLDGGTSNDTLYGEQGRDKLIGGAGKDALYGGSETDFFVFQKVSDSKVGSNRDVIADFSRVDDFIDVSKIDANTKVSGNQAFNFIGTSSFSGRAGELRFTDGIVSGDVNGDGIADFEIKVDKVVTLGADDFIL